MKRILIVTSLLFASTSFGQDVHFSQFWNNNIQYNPGMAGVIPANLRAALFYRDQWSIVGAPFKSYGFNLDTRIESKGNTSFGLGANLFRDVAGDNKLGTTHAQLSFSTILELDRHSRISLGVNGGLEQRGFDPGAAQWSSQYENGSYDASLPSGESFNATSEMKGDLSAGLVYYYTTSESYMTSNDQFNMKIGVAYNHILRPKFNWFSMGPDQLYSNLVAHAEFLIGLSNSKWSIAPAIIGQFQGPSKEILFGSQYRCQLKGASKVTGYVKGAYLNLGTFVRLGDAFIPSVAFEFDKYSIGLSYDVNISQLRSVSNGGGGFEVSLKFETSNPYLWQGYRTSRARFR